jgi:transcription-repair coupling factor (superfamily II helicase)
MKLPALPAKAGQKLTLGQLVGSSLALVAARLTREASCWPIRVAPC